MAGRQRWFVIALGPDAVSNEIFHAIPDPPRYHHLWRRFSKGSDNCYTFWERGGRESNDIPILLLILWLWFDQPNCEFIESKLLQLRDVESVQAQPVLWHGSVYCCVLGNFWFGARVWSEWSYLSLGYPCCYECKEPSPRRSFRPRSQTRRDGLRLDGVAASKFCSVDKWSWKLRVYHSFEMFFFI